MFTPQQRKGFSGWSISPRDAQRAGAGLGSTNPRNVKEKGIANALESGLHPPPAASLGENGGARFDADGDLEAWQRFRDAGLLDEAALGRRDRAALMERISQLDQELFDYQYNMGLLLIEKKEWTFKHEDLGQALTEVEELLKREQAAHLIAMSEVEQREENLRKALLVEKQCVADLEKALHKARSESEDLKFSSDKKLAEACASVADIDERTRGAERKLHAADAKLAEASRKSSDIERKLKELDAREALLNKEWLSLKSEHGEHEATFVKQREDLQDWEIRLQHCQDRLIEGQRLLNHRENRLSDKDRFLSQEEKDIEDERKKIEITGLNLKEREADISMQEIALAATEREAAILKQTLELKEHELRALEQKLNEKESMEMQKLIDQHNAFLTSKKHTFELEIDERRKFVDEELKGKLEAVQLKEDEINCKEEKLVKREQNLERNFEILNEKEKDYELRVKALKEREKSIKAEQKGMEVEKREIVAEKQDLLKLKAELENDRALLEEERHQILKERDNLRIMEEDRREFLSLQSKLKLEIDCYNLEKESLLREREDLKQERVSFEREWEALDDKRANVIKDLKQIDQEKEMLAKWKCEEEESLKSERLEVEGHIEREREALSLKKEAFERSMQHEQSKLLEKLQKDHDDMLRSFDLRCHDLETTMQCRQVDMGKLLWEKQRAFEEEREQELARINSLREQTQWEMAEMKLERQRLEREQQEVTECREHIERDRREIQNDIYELHLFSSNLSHERKAFMKERARFLAFVSGHESCNNCGALTFSSLQPLPEIEDSGPAFLPRLGEGYQKDSMKERGGALGKLDPEVSPVGTGTDSPASGGHMSWLQKCTSRIFNLSPGKKTEDAILHQTDGPTLFPMEVNREKSSRLDEAGNAVEASLGLTSDSVDIERIQSNNSIRERENEATPSIDEQSEIGKAQGASEALSASVEVAKDNELPMSRDSSRHRPGKKGRLRGTRSVKLVVEEAKAFLGEDFDPSKDEQPNGNAEELSQTNEGSKGASRNVDGTDIGIGRKRQYDRTLKTTASERDADDSEVRSDSVMADGRWKRRQTVRPGTQTPGEKRYNLRRSTVVGTLSATKHLSHQITGSKREDHPKSTDLPENEALADQTSKLAVAFPGGIASKNDKGEIMLHKTNVENLGAEVRGDSSSQEFVRVKRRELCDETASHVVRWVDKIEFSKQADDQREDREVEGVEVVAGDQAGYGSSEGDSSGDEEYESDNHEVSMGKKLWTFFTT